jgi:hypothetical protein
MSKISKRPLIRMPTVAEDREIRRAAKADPDAQPLTAKQFAEMVPLRSLRTASSKKHEVVDYFTGETKK